MWEIQMEEIRNNKEKMEMCIQLKNEENEKVVGSVQGGCSSLVLE